MWTDIHKQVEESVDYLKNFTSFRPKLAIALGTGLGLLQESLQDPIVIPYGQIVNFAAPGVVSHAGNMVLGYWQNIPIAMLSGRIHLYEGHHPKQVTMPIRVLAHWGADTFILTNAAGGLASGMQPGHLMLINDHINLTGQNPLVGQHVPQWGPQFPDMSQAYDKKLLTKARTLAERQGIPFYEGVYAGLLGPSLETPAETRMLKALGAQAVGMSTVLETIVARQHGARVLGISAITNINNPDDMQPTSLQEIIDNANLAGKNMATLITAMLPELV